MRNRKYGGLVPHQAWRLGLAAVAMTAGPALADASGNSSIVSGEFGYKAQLPIVCGMSAPLLCATGTFSGGIQGTFVNEITSLVPSVLVNEMVDFYTGSITITTRRGQLKCDLAGALQDSGDGEFGEICVITGGTGSYSGATGHLQLTGDSNTSGLPILGLSGSGEYRGKIVLP